MRAARAVFPLNPTFRMGEAAFYSTVRWPGSRDYGIAAIDVALETNPYAPDLHRNKASLLWEADRQQEAIAELMIMKRIAPRAPMAVMVNANPATR